MLRLVPSFFSTATAFGAVVIALLSSASATAQTFTKTLTYTRFLGSPNVNQAELTYNAGLGTVTLSAPIPVTHTPGADGVLFAPDGDLIVGGQADAVYKVAMPGPAFTGVTAGGALAFHVMLDPSGTKVWTSGNLGSLASVPLNPFANGTQHPLTGDDTLITHIVFANGNAYYTASLPTGNGNFGRIDLNTFTTTRLYSDVPWSHGAAYDCYTQDIMVFANSTIAQFDPVSETVVAKLDLSPIGKFINMDQGTSDGDGHIYVASNTGYLVFADITTSGDISAPDFVGLPFLDTFLDDVAPECGLGAPPACPHSQGYWKNHASAWPVTSLTMGCRTYTQAQLLAILRRPVRGDASVALAYQLIAAKLNVAAFTNSWPAIAGAIQQADTLLCTYSGAIPLGVRTTTTNGQAMTQLALQLEAYNLGRLSPGCSMCIVPR